MNNILKWVKLESIMTAFFPINGISASKFNRFHQPYKYFGEFMFDSGNG